MRFRLERARRVMHAGKRIVVVLAENAIRTRYCAEHDEQLVKLLSVRALPYVSLGIIPLGTLVRCTGAGTGFWIYDNSAVYLESPSAEIKVTRPGEIDIYARVFAHLQSVAVYGRDARRIITRALDDS
ncbi:hypothetical protein GCM10010123_30380 [Pilimelia anulata]|uniref:DUF5753 domain-containing protein n=1 Tax=Pilimelia anulata TaxID=53371 RepID=A0A8J3FC11_9ACTN|nr:hypothetical protein GCM10010123_30380 [Pilimelia anulata]